MAIRSLACAAFAAWTAGCASAPSRPIQAPTNAAVVVSDDLYAGIRTIDGAPVSKNFLGIPGSKGVVELAPGRHTLGVTYRDVDQWGPRSAYVFELDAEAGRVYHLKSAPLLSLWQVLALGPLSDGARLWIEDGASHALAGRTVWSFREPASSSTALGVPGSFAWTYPRQEKDMFVSRAEDGLRLDWKPAKGGDGYSVDIRVYERPVSTDPVGAFRERLHSTAGEIDPADKEQDEAVESVPGRAGCVRYRQISIGKKNEVRSPRPSSYPASSRGDVAADLVAAMAGEAAIAAMDLAFGARVLLERHGFSCSLPGQKGRAIVLEYAHRSTRQERDADAPAVARAHFDALKIGRASCRERVLRLV